MSDISMLLIDPNIVYLLLVVGLWLGITAVVIPGTGIVEILAVVGVIGSLVLLTQQPVNWVSVLMVVAGTLTFIVLPYVDRRLMIVSLGGLILQAVGGMTMFADPSVSPIIVGVTIILSLLYYRFALIPALESQKSKSALLDDRPLEGMRGRVKSSIDDVNPGAVFVNGETWTARLAEGVDDAIPAGTDVIIVERDGLTVYVEPIKPKRRPADDDNANPAFAENTL